MNRLTKITATAGVVLSVAVSATGSASATDTPPLEHLSASTESAVVYLETTWTGQVFDTFRVNHEQLGYIRNEPFSVTTRCTGFGVNPNGYIVTAGHCLEYTDEVSDAIIAEATAWSIKHYYDKDVTYQQALTWNTEDFRIDGVQRNGRPDRTVETAVGIALSGESTGSVLPARVLSVRGFDNGDVGLLKVETDNLPSLELADDSEVGVGTPVVSIGYPASVDLVTDSTFHPSYKDGTISSEKTIDDGMLPVFEVSAPVSGGMSGGPTVDLDGQVVGLNSFGIVGEDQPFNFIRPVSIIDEILQDKGVANEIGEVQESYQAGLDAFFAGDKVTAVSAFDQVLAQDPSHAKAQEYRAKAATLPDPVVEGSSGLPLLPMAIAGFVVLAALVAGGVTLAVRKTGSGIPTPMQQVDLTVQPNGQRHCTSCGARQELGIRFCSGCGTPAQPVQVH